MESQRSRGCGRALALGCGALLVVGLLAALLVWANLDRLREHGWFRSIATSVADTQAELAHMLVLRNQLLARHPAQRIEVGLRSKAGTGGRGRELVVTFVNPAFEMPEHEADRKSLARSLALEVTRSYPGIEKLDSVRIAFVSESGIGVKIRTTTDYPFKVSELRTAATP